MARAISRRGLMAIVAIVALAALGGLGWVWWTSGQHGGSGEQACQPAKPGEDFEPANQRDLQGDIRRNSYFEAGREYTIADGASLNVPEGVTLIIEPGARVRFGKGARLVVGGTLSACGRSSRRILFTADASTGSPGYWVGIEFHRADTDSVVGHATIEFGGRDNHAPLWVDGTNLKLEDIKFDTNQWYAVSADPSSVLELDGASSVENGPLGWEVRGGTLDKNRTWPAGQPVIVNGLVEVAESAVLTVPEAAEVKFLPGGGLRVRGGLLATGTEDAHVLFTSAYDEEGENVGTPKPGDWGGLQFVGHESVSRLEHVDVRYAGGAPQQSGCLWLNDASPVFQDVTVGECAVFPLSSDASSEPAIENLHLEGDGNPDEWEIRQSSLEGRRAWRWGTVNTDGGQELIRTITGGVTVGEEATLRLEPGLVLRFRPNSGLVVKGSLVAQGTPEQHILMTSWQDPEVGGPDMSALPGDWLGIVMDGGAAESSISHVDVRFAGSEAYGLGCLTLLSASPSIAKVTLSQCANYAIVTDLGANPAVDGLELTGNNPTNEWAIRESSLKSGLQRTWSPLAQEDATSPIFRVVIGRLTVEPGAQLTIKPGTVVKFREGDRITIRGSFKVDGDPQSHAVFTSWRDPEFSQESAAQPGDWGGIVLDRAQEGTHFNSVEIRYAGGSGNPQASLAMVESVASLSDIQIRDGGSYPISLDANSSVRLENAALSGSKPADAIEIRGSVLNVPGETTWGPISDADDQPLVRVVTGELRIAEGASLRLDPGTVLKFDDNGWVNAYGGILASGSTLTSLHDDEHGGDTDAGAQGPLLWRGIYLHRGGSARFNETLIRYADTGLWTEDANAEVHNTSIEECQTAAISADMTSSFDVDELSLRENGVNGLVIRAGTLPAGETRWSVLGPMEAQLVRVVQGMLRVSPQSIWNIDPGVVVKFAPQSGVTVEGGILAGEADGALVVFTSLEDSSVGAATEDIEQEPRRGSWLGININPNSPDQIVSLREVEIRYATVGLYLTNLANWDYQNVTIVYSQYLGLSCDANSLFLPEDPNLVLQDNGEDTTGCPTSDRQGSP
jgi:hypothetical protein